MIYTHLKFAQQNYVRECMHARVSVCGGRGYSGISKCIFKRSIENTALECVVTRAHDMSYLHVMHATCWYAYGQYGM